MELQMYSMPRRFALVLQHWLIPALLILAGHSQAQQFKGQTLVEASLVSDRSAIRPGEKFKVGLWLKMAPHWHTYWQYSGDSGLPVKIDWKLPPGFSAGPIAWPIPSKIVEPGDMLTYGYNGEVLLVTEITAPASWASPGFQLQAHADWLVCAEVCVPGGADLSLGLFVAEKSGASNQKLFEDNRARIPRPVSSAPFSAVWQTSPASSTLIVKKLGAGKSVDFFPLPGAVIVGHPSVTQTAAEEWSITVPSDSGTVATAGLLVVTDQKSSHTEGWQVESSSRPPRNGLLKFLLFGFIGGLILNVMPCVLPVIALKILGFLNQAGQSRTRIFKLGLAFIAGIFAWFLALAALIAGFKMAGRDLNWAFQFQTTWFVAFMAIIVLIFALNLLGLFEFVLPAAANSAFSNLSAREGYGGAFLHGAFATLLATPCTAPFLGPALGFAFSQPPAIIFVMFGAIAAGMSLPYFLLTSNPAWMHFLPRPGLWMVRVKYGMGVLLLATAAWLGWIIYQQQSAPATQPFDQTLATALKSDRTVFVDFTADWCVNCKVNERLVLRSSEVQDAFAKNNVLFLQADWTHGDPAITALLKTFGRAAVPLYVIYPADRAAEPIVLSELLSARAVLDGIAAARKNPD